MSEANGNLSIDSLKGRRDQMLTEVRSVLMVKRAAREALDLEILQLESDEGRLEALFEPSKAKALPVPRQPRIEQIDEDMMQKAFRFLVSQGINKKVRSLDLNEHFKPERRVRWSHVFAPLIRKGAVKEDGKAAGQCFYALRETYDVALAEPART